MLFLQFYCYFLFWKNTIVFLLAIASATGHKDKTSKTIKFNIHIVIPGTFAFNFRKISHFYIYVYIIPQICLFLAYEASNCRNISLEFTGGRLLFVPSDFFAYQISNNFENKFIQWIIFITLVIHLQKIEKC